jgi:hypothetical protein
LTFKINVFPFDDTANTRNYFDVFGNGVSVKIKVERIFGPIS